MPASSALKEARDGYAAPALSGLMGLDIGPARGRGRFVMTGGSVRVSSGPCSPAGRPGRGVSLYNSGASEAGAADIDARDDENGGGRVLHGWSSKAERRLEPGIPGPASCVGGIPDLAYSSAR